MGVVFIIAVASFFKYNGPYVEGTYAKGSLISSIWEARPLHPSRVEDDESSDEEDFADEKESQKKTNFAITNKSETTQSIQQSNVPLNQQLCAAVNLEDKQLFEGGETETIETQRGLATERAFNTEVEQKEDKDDPTEVLKKRMKAEAQKRLFIEGQVSVPSRYATLFNGLKLNTAHNSAVMEPLLFLTRRFLYAMVIVLLGHKPQVALMLMIALSVIVLTFTAVEKPWKDPDM